MGEMLICPHCEHLDAALKEKDDEIQKLKQKIQNLKNFFQVYCNKAKLYQISTFKGSNDPIQNCNYCHKELKSSVSGELNGKISCPEPNLICNENDNEEYVYDDTLSMHYCLSTGYFYDTKTGLFYIPENDAYYKFDYNKNEYELVKNEDQTTKNTTNENCESVVDKVSSLNLKDEDDSSVLNSSSNQEICDFDETKYYEKDNTNEESTEIKQEIIDVNESSNDWQPPEGSNTTVGDLVREVAEQNSGMSDYIYDEKSQMYYSKSTGYFYDPIRKLLYDPKHKIYYLYDQEKMSYDFYCHADSTDRPSPAKVPSETSKSNKAKKEHKVKKRKSEGGSNTLPIIVDSSSSTEEGEIYSSDSDSSQIQEDEIEKVSDSTSRLPCIRAIVESSHRIKNGSLILITCNGGVLGRGRPSSISVPDITVSKAHARVTFCYESKHFSIEDLGSQNGTFINEKRLSEPKFKSHPHNLKHGDKLSLGSCKMLIHVHEGYETCDKCEPGQVMAELSLQEVKEVPVLKTKEEKEQERRKALKNMKKKYGLGGMDYPSEKSTKSTVSKGYEDKAELRRKTVGSENPYEKTESSSINESVSNTNKGYEMLKKLGWKEGEPLGTSGTGIIDPISVKPWISKAGLGSSRSKSSSEPPAVDKRNMKWVKAQERYSKITS